MEYLFSVSKSAAENWLNASEMTLLVCGFVLAYGAAGEYLEEHDKLPRWMKWSREPKLIFVWMVALSLVGEFAGDAGVFISSRRLQSIQDQESNELRKQLGTAADSAKTAHDEAGAAHDLAKSASDLAVPAKVKADAVGKEADALSERIHKESAMMNAFGPRHLLLDASNKEISNSLARFAGQNVVVVRCDSALGSLLEERSTSGAILTVLLDESHWGKVGTPPSVTWNDCPIMSPGIKVIFCVEDGSQIKAAAEALAHELEKVLPPQPLPFLKSIDRKNWPEGLFKDWHEFNDSPEMPEVMVARNPGLIAVLVARQPVP